MYQRSSRVCQGSPSPNTQSQVSASLTATNPDLAKPSNTWFVVTMILLLSVLALLSASLLVDGVNGQSRNELKARGKAGGNQEALGSGIDGERYKTACPDYKHYAVVPQYVSFALHIPAVQQN